MPKEFKSEIKKEIKEKNNCENLLAVDAVTLGNMLCCGRATAAKIGTEAGARVQLGRRVVYKLSKVNQYLENRAGQ